MRARDSQLVTTFSSLPTSYSSTVHSTSLASTIGACCSGGGGGSSGSYGCSLLPALYSSFGI